MLLDVTLNETQALGVLAAFILVPIIISSVRSSPYLAGVVVLSLGTLITDDATVSLIALALALAPHPKGVEAKENTAAESSDRDMQDESEPMKGQETKD